MSEGRELQEPQPTSASEWRKSRQVIVIDETANNAADDDIQDEDADE